MIYLLILFRVPISVTESLFNVGITSIMFPNCVSQIEMAFGVKLTMERFIQNLTIEGCAKLLK